MKSSFGKTAGLIFLKSTLAATAAACGATPVENAQQKQPFLVDGPRSRATLTLCRAAAQDLGLDERAIQICIKDMYGNIIYRQENSLPNLDDIPTSETVTQQGEIAVEIANDWQAAGLYPEYSLISQSAAAALAQRLAEQRRWTGQPDHSAGWNK